MKRFFTHTLQHLFALLALGLVAAAASASPTAPQSGVEYIVLDRPQPTEAGKKIEVTEFFAYYCPHCYALDPILAAWVKKQGDNIVFKRVHVADSRVVPHQKLFYTLEALGKTEELHSKIFNAFHVERNRLQTDADVLAFVVKNGIDKQKFLDVYNSFTIQSKLRRSEQLMEAYQVDSWPKIAINGQIVTAPSLAATSLGRVSEEAQNQALIPVLDFLVARAQRANSGQSAAANSAASTATAARKKK